MREKKKVVTLCSGYDSQCMALDELKKRHPDFDYELVAWSEIDKYAIQMHNIVYPLYADRNLGDMTKIDWQPIKDKYGEIDLLTYSTPCFVAGTLVQTNHGLKPIEMVTTADMVLSHSGAYQRVLQVGSKKAHEIVRVKGMCIDEILCTPNHPFYVREMYRHGHKWARAFCAPKWKEARKLTKTDYMGIAINSLAKLPDWSGTILHYGGHNSFHVNKIGDMLESTDFWYLMSRYVGDGWVRDDKLHKCVCIVCSDRNEETLKRTFGSLGFTPTITDTNKSCRRYTVSSKELVEFVDRFGHGAVNKRIDFDTLSLPVHLLSRFLDGYVDSDGHRDSKSGEYGITTVSRELVYGVQQVVAKVHHRPTRLYYVAMPEKTVIDGREVNQRDFYRLTWHNDRRKQDQAFYEDGYVWYPCTGIESTDKEEMVFNMEVETDNSYTANGTIVHNCQSISQAGMQHGFAEGSGTRSSILWATEEAIRVLRPKILLQENVKAIISGRPDFYRKGKDGKMTETFWSLICKWMERVKSYGYTNTWSIINSKNMGVPQNRERFFLLSQREDVAIDYSWPKSKPLTTRLEDVLEEEVSDRYFLKDDAVSKFLKANDSDNALFLQFDLPPTHEAAMFLKTVLQIFMERHDGWDKGIEWNERELSYYRPAIANLYKLFKENPKKLDVEYWSGFYEMFKENMERKKDGV